MTLGKQQYDWLTNTLETSQAEFKFVFIHQLTGGSGKDSRGGAEAAEFFEWGGCNEAGINEFAQKRPGWEMPIHDLLVKYGVDVPQPGTSKNSISDALSYGYKSGVTLPSAGFIRVVVGPKEALVEYVKCESDGTYTIPNVYQITK
jgi:hypothetical protein